MSQTLSQRCHKDGGNSGTPVCGDIFSRMCIAPSEERSLFDQCLEVALECPSRRSRAKPVEIGDCEAAVLLCMGERKGLTLGQLVAVDEKVVANGLLAPLSDFDQLGGEAGGDEVRAVYFATGVR